LPRWVPGCGPSPWSSSCSAPPRTRSSTRARCCPTRRRKPAREIGRGLRCLVCQNQSIDDSNADLARDLRRIVRERIAAGDSDAEVVRFVTDRYGDYVLLRPPVNAVTIGLWAAPALLLLAGGAVAAAYLRRRRAGPAEAPPLSPEERARLRELGAE
jgi:cytochrome c-type biogenesis protein CcmH